MANKELVASVGLLPTPLRAPMSGDFSTANKEVLVEIVRLAQKRGLKGAKGGWKEFLASYDRKFGVNLSDPAKRSPDMLMAFLETFSQEEDLEFFSKVARHYNNLKAMEKLMRDLPGCESPKQKLVCLTVQHPLYVQYYNFPSLNEDWMVIPLGRDSKLTNINSMIAVDCEMVLCQDGTDAVVQVCAVDHNLEVKLNQLVRPNKPISDFRTNITGICPEDLEGVSCSLVDVQKSLRELLSHGTILIGHSLHNDLQALKIDYPRVIDTSYIFKCVDMPNFRTPSLNSLCKSVLGTEVRKDGDVHNCLADAEATMKLALAKIEHGFDDPITIEGKKVSKSDLAKLLLHKVPVDVPCLDLLKLFPDYSNIYVQPGLKFTGQSYSAYVVFKDCKEAFEAFEDIEGQQEKDYIGRPQKLVSLSLNGSKTIRFYVRKMMSGSPSSETPVCPPSGGNRKMVSDSPPSETPDCPPGGCNRKMVSDSPPNGIVTLKRNADANANGEGLRRPRMVCEECNHVQEIQRLKQELRQREDEIFDLQKTLSAFMEKIQN